MIAAILLAQTLAGPLAFCESSSTQIGTACFYISQKDEPLDKAHYICKMHTTLVISANVPQALSFEPAWAEDCSKVEALWLKTEAADQERQRKAQEEANRKLVHDVAIGRGK